MRFNLTKLYYTILFITLILYAFILFLPDTDTSSNAAPTLTMTSATPYPTRPTITIIIKPYCPTLTPLAADANSSEEYLRLHTRCRAGDWMYMSPTPTPTIDTTKRDLSTRIPCPSMTPLPVDASMQEIQRRNKMHCFFNGEWKPFSLNLPQTRNPLGTNMVTRVPSDHQPQFNAPNSAINIFHPKVRKFPIEALMFLIVVVITTFKWIVKLLAWTAKALAVFFDYLNRFAEYLLNLFDKNKE